MILYDLCIFMILPQKCFYKYHLEPVFRRFPLTLLLRVVCRKRLYCFAFRFTFIMQYEYVKQLRKSE